MHKTTKTSTSHILDYRAAARGLLSRWTWVRWIVALLTTISLIVLAWRIPQHGLHLGGFTGKGVTPLLPPAAAFYRGEISPLLDAALQRNREAGDRAIASLHERFDTYRAGIKPFAKDVSAWRTRLGVIGCLAADLWNQHGRGDTDARHVGDYIQEKFRVHIVSEQSLQADIEEVLKQYRDDLEASRNRLFAEIKLPLQGSQSPIILDDPDRLRLDIDKRARQLNATTPRDSVVTGLASVAGGWAGSEAGELIVAEILARVGTVVAVDAAAAGGTAMVGGTATGGSVGSFAGPAGSVVGVGIGLAIGAAVDWWMSDRLETHVTDQCNRFLDSVEHKIVDGSDHSPGLRASFEQAAKLADQNQRQAIIDALLEAGK